MARAKEFCICVGMFVRRRIALSHSIPSDLWTRERVWRMSGVLVDLGQLRMLNRNWVSNTYPWIAELTEHHSVVSFLTSFLFHFCYFFLFMMGEQVWRGARGLLNQIVIARFYNNASVIIESA